MSMTTVYIIAATMVGTLLLAAIAMNFSTSQKHIADTIAHHAAIGDAQFRREMSVMLGPSLLDGNRVEPLQNGVQIFPSMLEAIAGARRTVTFESFIYWSGEIGDQFAEALRDAAGRGVAVHVILDWVGSLRMSPELVDRLERSGVQVRMYRPLRFYHLGRMNNRTHRKLLVVDGTIGFTGGVGIADAWLGNAETADEWRDTHYRVEGPVVAQLQAAFNDNWIKTTGHVLVGDAYFPALSPVGTLTAHVFVGSPATGGESMHLMFLMAVTAAVESIDIAAAYFVPDVLLVRALIDARLRGVRIRVLVPGQHIDSTATRLASKASWGELLRSGVQIFVYEPTMLHTKLMVIDHEFVSVGSTNVDLRSFTLNDEASLNIYDSGFADDMRDVFEGDLQRAKSYTWLEWTHRPWTERLAERVVVPFRSQL